MEGPKRSWRQRLQLRSSKRSTSEVQPPTIDSSTNLKTQSTSVISNENFPSSSTQSVQTDNTCSSAPLSQSSTLVLDQLLQDALQNLTEDDRITIEKHLPPTLSEVQSIIRDTVNVAQHQRQICYSRRDIILGDKADKIIHWLDRFKSVGDVAVNADPIHAGLPWAGIRLLLEVVTADLKQMTALLSGCETVLYMSSRLESYVEFWSNLPASATQNDLASSITAMYTEILQFLAQAIQIYQTPTLKRTAVAFWTINDIVNFDARIESLAAKVERDANNCNRALSAQDRRYFEFLNQNMSEVLMDLQQYRQMQSSVDQLHLKIDLDKIPHAKGAIYNSSDGVHTLCHPATRNDILSQIQKWTEQPTGGRNIFWLYGAAGSGKSTISWTFAQWLTESGNQGGVDLGASFFFKRGEGDRGSAERFFPTLIRQLITKIPGLDVLVAKAIDADRLIFDKALPEQFRCLMLQPLQNIKVPASSPAMVVVLDALDECEKQSDIITILDLWSQLSTLTNIRLRLFLTSRPEIDVRLVFLRMSIDRFRGIDLVDAVPLNTIQHDLSVYLHDTLCSIRDDYNRRFFDGAVLNDDWPDERSVTQLVNIASPLFIIAATMCRLIGDLEFDPQERLRLILSNSNVGQLSEWERTYLPVLAHLTNKIRDQEQERLLCHEFRTVVGSIVLLAEPLSANSLALLVDVPVRSVNRRLASLHSVLRVPSDSNAPIRTLHLSFKEFLLSDQAQHQPFGVNESSTHLLLARACLKLLSGPEGLCENICKLDNPGQPRQEVPSTTIMRQLPPVFQYASRYWIHHLAHSSHILYDDSEVRMFLEKHFLHWLEAMSFMNRISETISLLKRLKSCVSTNALDLLAFLEDARRFVLAHRYIINISPLQLYSSAIIFSPENSLVRQICGNFPSWIQQYPRDTLEWNSELLRLEGHSGPVSSVLILPESDLIVSGSYDSTIRLWDIRTGQELQKLEGHSKRVTSIACSPDGLLIASASFDCTIRLWDVQTGREVGRLKADYDEVETAAFSFDFYGSSFSPMIHSIAYSPNGTLLATGSADRTVRLWDVRNMQQVQKFKGHSGAIFSVTFSPDSTLVASGSSDETFRVWNVKDGSEIHRHAMSVATIESVAFSPDGTLLASASTQHELRVFEVQNWRLIHEHKYQTGIMCVAFSPDGTLIGSGSSDGTIRMWDTRTWQKVQHLNGHPSLVNAIVFSPQNTLLATGSYDQTIRVWELKTTQRLEASEERSSEILSLAFSPNGHLLASGNNNDTVQLWDAQTGHEIRHFRGHSGVVNTVAFSPNGSQLASGSGDNTIRIWDIQTGSEIRCLEGHYNMVTSIMFSPDGSLLASGAIEKTLRIWSIEKGQEMKDFKSLSGQVHLVRFSPDGLLLAVACLGGIVWLWNTRTWKEPRRLNGRKVAFSLDSSLLASGADDDANTIQIWDLRSGQLIRRFHDAPINPAFSFVGNTALITEKGVLNVGEADGTDAQHVQHLSKSVTVMTGSWLRQDNLNLLWLPKDYRGLPQCHNTKLAIASKGGQVSFFQLQYFKD